MDGETCPQVMELGKMRQKFRRLFQRRLEIRCPWCAMADLDASLESLPVFPDKERFQAHIRYSHPEVPHG